MGWSSANEIVDPQVQTLVKAVENDEMQESVARKLLFDLIKNCQHGDWDTEDETLELFTHVPWVVEVFKECDIEMRVVNEDDLKLLVLGVINAGAEQWYDLSENFWRLKLAEAIAASVYPKVEEWA